MSDTVFCLTNRRTHEKDYYIYYGANKGDFNLNFRKIYLNHQAMSFRKRFYKNKAEISKCT